MKKWYVDDSFVRNGEIYDRGYYIREDGIIEWSEPIQNGATHEFPIGECFHPVNPLSVEPGHPIMIEDGESLGKLVEGEGISPK